MFESNGQGNRPGLPEPWSARPSLPLNGVVVAEMADNVAVSFCGRLLADYGATVIKVESSLGGDGSKEEIAQSFGDFLDAGKLSVSLDPAHPSASELTEELLNASDLVVRFGVRRREARPYDSASARPIEIDISWLGQTGPWSAFACDDFLAQHMSGMAFSSALRVDDLAANPPRAVPGHLAEMVAGLTSATAGLVAWFGRELTGNSERVDVSVAESLASFMRYEVVIYSYGMGISSRSKLARSPVAAPVFQQATSDGYVDMLIMQEAPWRALLGILGNPAWGDDEIFSTHPRRSEYWDALEPLLQEELRRVTSEYVYREGQRVGVAVAPVNSVAQAASAAQFAERRFFAPVPMESGDLQAPGAPFRFQLEPVHRSLAPTPGRDNEEVFRTWLGVSEDRVDAANARTR